MHIAVTGSLKLAPLGGRERLLGFSMCVGVGRSSFVSPPPPGADPGFRMGGFLQEFRLENRSYPDVHDFLLRMQVIIAND